MDFFHNLGHLFFWWLPYENFAMLTIETPLKHPWSIHQTTLKHPRKTSKKIYLFLGTPFRPDSTVLVATSCNGVKKSQITHKITKLFKQGPETWHIFFFHMPEICVRYARDMNQICCFQNQIIFYVSSSTLYLSRSVPGNFSLVLYF